MSIGFNKSVQQVQWFYSYCICMRVPLKRPATKNTIVVRSKVLMLRPIFALFCCYNFLLMVDDLIFVQQIASILEALIFGFCALFALILFLNQICALSVCVMYIEVDDIDFNVPFLKILQLSRFKPLPSDKCARDRLLFSEELSGEKGSDGRNGTRSG